jgi:hypothetical protein
VISSLRALHQNEAAREIPSRKFDGMRCPGFQFEERQATVQVWVNPITRLPLQAERSFKVNEAPPPKDGVIRPGKSQITESYVDMQFDEPLPDKLFDVSPPEGFALTTVGTPPADRRELFAEPLVLVPLKGAGPLQFGTSEAEILQLLGKPDKVTAIKPEIPISDEITQVGDQPRPPGGQMFVLTEHRLMEYNALGMILTVEVHDGLTGIACLGQDVRGPTFMNFQGSTDKSIHLGSTEAEIREAYGEPDKQISPTTLAYAKLGLQFHVDEVRKAARSITAADGLQHGLRFEWRVPVNRLPKDLRALRSETGPGL